MMNLTSFITPSVQASQPPDLTIVGQSPAAGSVVSERVQQVAIEFDRPVDPYSLGSSDLYLVRIAPDGTTTRVLGDNTPLVETLDSTGTVLTAVLPQNLAPGHYQISLSGLAFLMGTDGSLLSTIGVDTPLGGFTVTPPAPTLADAIDLGRLSTEVTAATGRLDLENNPHDVGLYRFEVTPQFALSRVGIEVEAQRDGSPLDAAILLLDADGSSIAYNDVGRPADPRDPYLFQGLKPGTYYLAVVGHGMGYGLTGRFDPAHPPLQPSSTNPTGGSYTVKLVADPGETPAALIGFGLLHQDPQDPDPTGFTLQFNAPLAVADSNGLLFDVISQGVQVTDAGGRVWPVAGVAYNEAESTLTYVFRQRLPQGAYTVRIPSSGGLVDLSGHTPTAFGPGGALGTFDVAAPTATEPGNLGVYYPDDILATVNEQVTIAPGATVSLRFSLLYYDVYNLLTKQSGGVLNGSISDAGSLRSRALQLGSEGATVSSSQPLGSGVHVLTLTNPGSTPVTFYFNLTIAAYHWESLLQNGIGQGPALSLRVIAPTYSAPTSTPAADSSPAVEPSTGDAALFPAALSVLTSGFLAPGGSAPVPNSTPRAEPSPVLAPASSTVLYLTIAGQPVGSPHAPVYAAAGRSASRPAVESAGGFGQALGVSGRLAGHSGGGFTSAGVEVENVPGADATPEDQVVDIDADTAAELLAAVREPVDSMEEFIANAPGEAAVMSAHLDGSLPDGPADATWALPVDRLMPEEAKVFDPGLALGLIASVAIHYRQAIRRWCSRFRRVGAPPRRAPQPLPRRVAQRSRDSIRLMPRASLAESREYQVVP
jgi:hypothetical protein